MIHCAIDYEVSALGQRSECLGRLVALFRAQIEAGGRLLTAQRRRIGYANNLQLVGVRQRIAGIGQGAVAGADDDSLQRFTHVEALSIHSGNDGCKHRLSVGVRPVA